MGGALEKVITLAESRPSRRTVEQIMWDHYQRAIALVAETGRRPGSRESVGCDHFELKLRGVTARICFMDADNYQAYCACDEY